MRNIFFIGCLLFSISTFSQEKEVVKEGKLVPTSIFAANSLDYQSNNENMASLHLKGHKFMIIDFFDTNFSFSNAGRIKLDLRNFGRHISYDDLSDNYGKAKFNRHNVTTNSDHYIWNIPLGRKQLLKQNEQIKNN